MNNAFLVKSLLRKKNVIKIQCGYFLTFNLDVVRVISSCPDK